MTNTSVYEVESPRMDFTFPYCTVDGSEIRLTSWGRYFIPLFTRDLAPSLVVVWDFWTINSMTLQFEASNHWMHRCWTIQEHLHCQDAHHPCAELLWQVMLFHFYDHGLVVNLQMFHPAKMAGCFIRFFSNVGLTYTVPLFPSLDLLQVSKIRNEFAEGLQFYQLHSDPRSDLLAANPHNDW